MKEENFEIRYQNHFKLYVLLKDKILFENELEKRGIKYSCDLNEQPFFNYGIRYFFLDSDAKVIDEILIESQIIATNETAPFSDYRDEQKIMKIFLVIAGITALIVILIVIYDKLF